MDTDQRDTLSVDAVRLYHALDALGQVGGQLDERSQLIGVTRVALSATDIVGRQLVMAWMRELGLDIRVDEIGNVYGRRAGRDPALAPVVTGSHIDSVPSGGRFDGCLGVLAGLEVMRTLDDHDITTERPLEVAFFTEEEGHRFGTDMLGSAVAAGRIALDDAYGKTDRDGVTVHDELAANGFLGSEPARLDGDRRPHAYVELHIEQGPILRAADVDVGVVSGVQAICWQQLQVRGRSAHAGTTPMALRRDAGVAAARINLEVREMIRSGRYPQLLGTVGVVVAEPGVINIVPGRCRLTVDLRSPQNDALVAAERDIRAYYDRVADEEGVEITCEQLARTEHVSFDRDIQALIVQSSEERGLRHQAIVSGAGHDAQEMAAVCPTAMIFIPGEYDGISHNPRELSTLEQCERGANVLLDVMCRLAEQSV